MKKYGRLTVIGKEGKTRDKHKCKCDCGVITFVVLSSLRSGHTKSCGCLSLDSLSKRMSTHKSSKTFEYRVWVNMRTRCKNKNHGSYEFYGARGIKVCDEWDKSFESFISYMGKAPSNKHSIDRIDPNGNYEPGNCKWATMKEQSINKRNNVYITYKNETKTISQWCEELNLKFNNVWYRYKKGWDIEKVLSKETYRGESKAIVNR